MLCQGQKDPDLAECDIFNPSVLSPELDLNGRLNERRLFSAQEHDCVKSARLNTQRCEISTSEHTTVDFSY